MSSRSGKQKPAARKPKQWDIHHIFPRSLFPQFAASKWNQRPVRRGHHVAWHLLIGNQSPLAGLVQLFHEFTPYDKKLLRDDPALPLFLELLITLEKAVEK